MIWVILKVLCLTLAIMSTFDNIGKLIRGSRIPCWNELIMAASIVGYIYTEFWREI